MRFTPTKPGFAGSEYAGWDFHRTSLTCPQIKRRSTHRGGSRPARSTEASRPKDAGRGANRPVASKKGTSGQLLIASNARAHDPHHTVDLEPEGIGGSTKGSRALSMNWGAIPVQTRAAIADCAIRTSPV
jgi:hypothetical protein